MAFRVNHNIRAINANRNLQFNQADLSKSLERLSSGLRINRASDGPAAFAISEHLRSQIAGVRLIILRPLFHFCKRQKRIWVRLQVY